MSVLVLGYNQEPFIESAIASAFGQRAEGLEIVLSDDSSRDGTFAKMQQMADAYAGPHIVKCRRNDRNLGTNAHLNLLVEQAQSDRIMCIAGDDLSAAHRAETLINLFKAEDALLIHSDADSIDVEGRPVEVADFRKATFFRSTAPEDAALSLTLYLGATVGFHKDLFRKYGPLPRSNAYEDLVLGFRAAMEGRVSFARDRLVSYRVDIGVSRQNAPAVTDAEYVAQRLKRLALEVDVLEQREKDALLFYGSPDNDIVQTIHATLAKRRLQYQYHSAGLLRGDGPFHRKLRTAFGERKRLRKHRSAIQKQ